MGYPKQAKRKRKRTFIDANLRVPQHLTTLLSETILTEPQDGAGLDYLRSELMRKFVSRDTDPAEVRRSRAIAKWLATEERNAITNERLRSMDEDYNILPRVTWGRFRSFVRGCIVRVLGEVPPDEAFIGSYSGGASTSRKRTEGHPALKYTGQAHSTSAAWDVYAGVTLPQCPGLTHNVLYQGVDQGFTLVDYQPPVKREPWPMMIEALERLALTTGFDRTWIYLASFLPQRVINPSAECGVKVVQGNVLFTVPKDATIDRVACKEPDINMYLQKGIGNFIRRRLRGVGIDLNDQSRNQRLAREGSITGALATVDLSSASDSVSSELVWELLPPLWASAMDAVRSPVTLVDGEVHVNEMFSSMGNGFTFELESLLFWSIARAVTYFEGSRGTVSVYGDDIIIPSDCYPLLEWVFGVLGFSVNSKKSFASGPFRESCGGHYHHGIDITPFYLRQPIRKLTDLILALNQLRLWSSRNSVGGVLDPTFEELWKELAEYVPQYLRGGQDYNSNQALVTPDRPRKMLVPVKGKGTPTETSGYVFWLNCTSGRLSASDGVESSEKLETAAAYRVKKSAYSDRRSMGMFPFEIR